MVAVFCDRLNWWGFESLIQKLQERLSHGVEADIVPLVQIPHVKPHRARALYTAGYRTPLAVAAASPEAIEKIIGTTLPYRSKKAQQHAQNWCPNDNDTRLARLVIKGAKALLAQQALDMKMDFEEVSSALQPPQSLRPGATVGVLVYPVLRSARAAGCRQKRTLPRSDPHVPTQCPGTHTDMQCSDIPCWAELVSGGGSGCARAHICSGNALPAVSFEFQVRVGRWGCLCACSPGLPRSVRQWASVFVRGWPLLVLFRVRWWWWVRAGVASLVVAVARLLLGFADVKNALGVGLGPRPGAELTGTIASAPLWG